jgi:hypothetical protein
MPMSNKIIQLNLSQASSHAVSTSVLSVYHLCNTAVKINI